MRIRYFFTICLHFLLFLAFWPLSLLLLFSYSLLPHLLPVSIPLQFSSSLKSFFLYFCPLCYFLSFYSHPSSTHFLSLSNPICQMFDQLRQHEEINSFYYSCILFLPLHLSIHHIWPSNLAELLWSAPHKRTDARHTNIKCLVFLFLRCQQPPVLSSFVHCVARSQSAESIAPLHLTVHSIRLNNGSMLD